jgi:hypothetical protein
MQRDIKESDWKKFRQLRLIALDRFCQRVLSEINVISSDLSKTNHERYGKVFGIIEKRDKELADMFDAESRSRAFMHLILIQSRDLLTQEEMSVFSPELQEYIRGGLELVRGR